MQKMQKIRKMQRDAKNARYATCETVSVIEHRADSRHNSDLLQCCEPCRASDRIRSMDIFFPPAFFHFFTTIGAFPPDALSVSPRDIAKFRVRHDTRRGV